MGNVPEKDTKRNEALIADYIKHTGKVFHYSTAQLVAKYKVSTSRIYEILRSYGVPRRTKKKK